MTISTATTKAPESNWADALERLRKFLEAENFSITGIAFACRLSPVSLLRWAEGTDRNPRITEVLNYFMDKAEGILGLVSRAPQRQRASIIDSYLATTKLIFDDLMLAACSQLPTVEAGLLIARSEQLDLRIRQLAKMAAGDAREDAATKGPKRA